MRHLYRTLGGRHNHCGPALDLHYYVKTRSRSTRVPRGNPLQTRHCDPDITLVTLEKKVGLV
jgi:hypothetical protein